MLKMLNPVFGWTLWISLSWSLIHKTEVMVTCVPPAPPTVSCNGPVVSFWVPGLGAGSEPLPAPGHAHAPTLPLPGRPHARSGRWSARLNDLNEASAQVAESLVMFAAAPRIHAGLGPHHPGAGDLLPWLAGSHHPATEQGTGTTPSLVILFMADVQNRNWSHMLALPLPLFFFT